MLVVAGFFFSLRQKQGFQNFRIIPSHRSPIPPIPQFDVYQTFQNFAFSIRCVSLHQQQ